MPVDENQYKTSSGGAWTDISAAAITGTLRGGPVVVWPETTERTISGRPCGATGLPKIVIKSQYMDVTGFKWWSDLVTSGDSVAFWISAFNPRADAWAQYTGYLCRPRASSIVIGGTAQYYTDVTVEIVECKAV